MGFNYWQLKFNLNNSNGGHYFRLHLPFVVGPDQYPTVVVKMLKRSFFKKVLL